MIFVREGKGNGTICGKPPDKIKKKGRGSSTRGAGEDAVSGREACIKSWTDEKEKRGLRPRSACVGGKGTHDPRLSGGLSPVESNLLRT